MPDTNFLPHLSDEELLLDLDGELSERDAASVEAHLAACWNCRVRRREMETAITDFVRFQQQNLDPRIPPPAGPRALLKAQLAQRSKANRNLSAPWLPLISWQLSWALAALMAAGIALVVMRDSSQRHSGRFVAVTVPNRNLTPGATVLLSPRELCMETIANNRAVPASLRRRVFAEYGIASAEPRAYEVDYLITPALGGADDIRNLWPQSNTATVWNAQVKDALEDHLRGLVCDGQLDLETAQRDIAGNWIEAYKKYFHTDQPRTMVR